MQAVEIGNEEIIKMLLDKGAKPDTIVNYRTPLSVAKEKGKREIIALLESYLPSWSIIYGWKLELMKFGESMYIWCWEMAWSGVVTLAGALFSFPSFQASLKFRDASWCLLLILIYSINDQSVDNDPER